MGFRQLLLVSLLVMTDERNLMNSTDFFLGLEEGITIINENVWSLEVYLQLILGL